MYTLTKNYPSDGELVELKNTRSLSTQTESTAGDTGSEKSTSSYDLLKVYKEEKLVIQPFKKIEEKSKFWSKTNELLKGDMADFSKILKFM